MPSSIQCGVITEAQSLQETATSKVGRSVTLKLTIVRDAAIKMQDLYSHVPQTSCSSPTGLRQHNTVAYKYTGTHKMATYGIEASERLELEISSRYNSILGRYQACEFPGRTACTEEELLPAK